MEAVFKYPTLTDAELAGVDLFKYATGQVSGVPPADLVKDCYVVLGYGLSLGFPVKPSPVFGDETVFKQQLADCLLPLCPEKNCVNEASANNANNVNWGKLIQLAIMLLGLLGNQVA